MKYIKYGLQSISKSDIKSVIDVLRSNFLTSGSKIPEFENNLKNIVKSRYVVACSSGTSALHIAFNSINLRKGDVVILPSINFIAAANICNYLGAKIFFSDVDSLTGQMSTKNILDCVKKNKIKHIKAICFMHNGGVPLNFLEMKIIKKTFKCFIVEDACHALGAMYSKKKKEFVGNCKYSDVATFSFHPVKSITTGEGGAITTNKKHIYKSAILFRNHGIQRKISNKKNHWDYKINSIGFNYRITDIQSALGISQLKRLNLFINKREKIAKNYQKFFKDSENITYFINNNKDIKSAWHLFILNISFENLKISKNNFIQYLHNKRIGVQVHYIPNNYQPLYSDKKNNKLKFVGAKKYFNNSISIPIYPDLKKKDQLYVVKTIKEYIDKFKK